MIQADWHKFYREQAHREDLDEERCTEAIEQRLARRTPQEVQASLREFQRRVREVCNK